MMTKNKFSYLLWNSVTESADKRYRHHLIKVYANKQNDFIAEMTSYVQKAHEDAKQYIRRALGDPLDPIGYSIENDPAEGYPETLDMHTLKGYFGEIFAGLIAEYCSPFGEDTWKVPAFLFRYHKAAFDHLELMRQTGEPAHHIPGRLGDDCLAFQLDDKGQIVRSLYCEAKCTANHRPQSILDAFEKVSKAVIVDVRPLIYILLDSTEPDASQWIEALRKHYLHPIPEYERCDLISYVCRVPDPRESRERLSTKGPHPKYTANRRLEAVEVQLPNVESTIQEVYGIKDATGVLVSAFNANKDDHTDL